MYERRSMLYGVRTLSDVHHVGPPSFGSYCACGRFQTGVLCITDVHRNKKQEDDEVNACAQRSVDIVMDVLGNNLAIVNIQDTACLLAYCELVGAVQGSHGTGRDMAVL